MSAPEQRDREWTAMVDLCAEQAAEIERLRAALAALTKEHEVLQAARVVVRAALAPLLAAFRDTPAEVTADQVDAALDCLEFDASWDALEAAFANSTAAAEARDKKLKDEARREGMEQAALVDSRMRRFVVMFLAWYPDCAQLLDGWHSDGTAWTKWDETVRNRLSTLGKEAHSFVDVAGHINAIRAAAAGDAMSLSHEMLSDLRKLATRPPSTGFQWRLSLPAEESPREIIVSAGILLLLIDAAAFALDKSKPGAAPETPAP